MPVVVWWKNGMITNYNQLFMVDVLVVVWWKNGMITNITRAKVAATAVVVWWKNGMITNSLKNSHQVDVLWFDEKMEWLPTIPEA